MTEPRPGMATVGAAFPAYGDVVSSHAAEVAGIRAPRSRIPHLLLAALGVALILAPLLLGMFTRAAQGQEMIVSFAPYIQTERIAEFRADLATVDAARENVAALELSGHAPVGDYPYVAALVREYPSIDADMSAMLDTVESNAVRYQQLSSLPPFALLPWLFVLPGLAFVLAGALGWRAARRGRRSMFATGVAGLAVVWLLVVPFAGGFFTNAPSGTPLLQDFSAIMTHDRVRQVQGYFVTLAGGQGELNSRYTKAVLAADPGADVGAIAALEARWQPMTSQFAGLIGVLNDNVDNYTAVSELNDSTAPLGFSAFDRFGWFFLLPGLAGLGVLVAEPARVLLDRRRATVQGENR
ncbi:hypothetical protein OG921_20015 [Aldersonia sp. NBC_00410]|uniref:hypothetical protein n=1 Tax=Aldersonia sp. NBC_00410 TaxID=2975954 RepID=UPI002254C2AC|nr:hypothetical protein [Aldersonia sp. NBC_00410]MCX5045459.1 hypothetical protein [Aldersonia sp. NBC_00410]